jgi:hypothetical protein
VIASRFSLREIYKRLMVGKKKKLSIKGKEILLKEIGHVIPVYAMSAFLIPKGICKKMMDAIAKFW